MGGDPLRMAIGRLFRRVLAAPSTGVSDAELLERFVRSRDEAAIETVLWRHGPMVMSVCRRMLGNEADSEDCFQAVFLVLCRKAAAIAKRPSLGCWLYKVAYRICLRARAARSRLPVPAAEIDAPAAVETMTIAEREELRLLLDDALRHLPERYRAPLVLHYLEQKTVAQVSQELGWRPGTVSSRLARGKEMLRLRLAGRGWALSAGAATAALASATASAAVPLPLARTTLQALFTGAASQPAASLAQEFLRAQLHHRLKWAVALLLAVGMAAGGMGAIWTRDRPDDPDRADAANPDAHSVVEDPLRVDVDGDPLPQGAILRLGSARWRGYAGGAAFSPDGRTLTTVGDSLRTWDAATGRPLESHNHEELLRWSPFSVGTQLVAMAGSSMVNPGTRLYRITLRNMRDLSVHRVLEVPGRDGGLTFCFSGDGKRLAAARNHEFRVWDVLTGRLVSRLRLLNESYVVYLLALSPDGKLLAGQDFGRQAVRILDVDSGKERKPLAIAGKRLGSAAFSGNGSVLMTVGGSEIQLWNPSEGKLIRSFASPVEVAYAKIAFSGKIIATRGADGSIRLWDATTGTATAVIYPAIQFGFRREVLAFSPDDKSLVLNGGPQIEIWDVATVRRVRVPNEPDLAHRVTGCQVAVSPDCTIVATCRSCTIQLWDARTGQQIGRDLDLGDRPVQDSLAFSADGKFLICQGWGILPVAALLSSANSSAGLHPAPFPPPPRPWSTGYCSSADLPLLRSIASGKWPQWVEDSSLADVLALSPRGDTVARLKRGTNDDWMVSLRDFTTGQELSCVPCAGRCWSAVFSPDGRRVAVGCARHVKLWDIAAGREVRRFEEAFFPSARSRPGFRPQLAISPDGTVLAVAGADNASGDTSIRLWDVATGRELSPLRGHHGVVQSLAFFPDGKRLLSGSSDTTALVWELSTVQGK